MHSEAHFNAQNGDIEPPPECEYCGEPGTEADPLVNTIISPPVDGYKFETMLGHSRCCGKAAADMVR